MVDNLTKGPVQVISNDVPSLNVALLDLQERIDELSGLRGRAMIYDRTRIDSPLVDTDAVDLQSLLDQESRTRMDIIAHPGTVIFAPGTTYAEISTAYRQNLDFADITAIEARIMARGWGTESGSGKGVALHDGTNVVAEVLWNGNTEALRVGAFTTVSLDNDVALQLHAKGSSATEDLIIGMVVVELAVTIRVVST